MKMAVVGCEASGKTVFMCALADYYGLAAAKNPLRLRLTPENSAANSFERYQYRQMRCLKQWPLATSPERTISMKWSLRRDGKSLAEVEMLEFGGETYRAAFRDDGNDAQHDASAKELLAYLADSDFFVVLLSLKDLLSHRDDISNDDFARETEALWVTRGILNFIRTKRPDAGVVIGLTQADLFRNELGEAGGPQQLFAARWPTVAAATQGIPVVEVASVSKTDANGNPAEGYLTHGILPVMKAFSKHCFGDENALENGSQRLITRTLRKRLRAASTALAAVAAAAVAFGIWQGIRHLPLVRLEEAPSVPAVVTNVLEKIVQVDKIVERQVTNTIERVVEKPVTNTVEKIVEKQVTNTVEKVIEKPVTNTVEKVVEKVVSMFPTNAPQQAVELPAAPESVLSNVPSVKTVSIDEPSKANTDENLKEQVPPGYRIWTDYNGRKIIARWTGVAVDESGITIITRYNRRIDAVLWKFSAEDQAYIKQEIKRHNENGEILSDGVWVRNPLFKSR